jgi:uncharacterized protein (TIGR02117 family)
MKLLRTAITRTLLLLGAIIGLYILAGIGGSLVPVNADWEEPDTGILLYVHDNGIHTGLVLPRQNAIADWSDLVRPEHLGDPRYASDHLLFGWGDRAFYLETPSWSNLKASTALAALFGSEGTLLHVDHIGTPRVADDLRPIRVTPGQYRRIAAAIRSRFALDDDGQSQAIAGYGAADIFYAAHGRYNALATCNEWTGSVLRDAGVRMGAWTPFNFGVMRWLRSHAVDTG